MNPEFKQRVLDIFKEAGLPQKRRVKVLSITALLLTLTLFVATGVYMQAYSEKPVITIEWLDVTSIFTPSPKDETWGFPQNK